VTTAALTAAEISSGELAAAPATAPPSFVKLAMRNMVRKGRQSLVHFALTALALMGFLVLVAWLGRPIAPQ
jgi:hypothetical protein